MNGTTFMKSVVPLQRTSEECSLPWAVNVIVQLIATPNLLKLEQMPKEYVDCEGFNAPGIDSDWRPLLQLYPGLYTVLAYCVVMLLTCVLWWIFKAVQHKSDARESLFDRKVRRCLLLFFLLLLVLLAFFLWFAIMSYMSCPVERQQVKSNTMVNATRPSMRQLYEDYAKTIGYVLEQNVIDIKKYMSTLPHDLVSLLKQAVEEVNKSDTEHFYKNSYMINLLLEEMLEDINTMLIDFSEFIDHIRLFYRNTTVTLQSNGVDTKLYNAMMLREIASNGAKMAMLIHIKEMILEFAEVVTYIGKTHRQHNAMLDSIDYLQRLHVDNANETWFKNAFEFNNFSSSMSESLRNMSTQITTARRVYLPKYLEYAELVFCIIVAVLVLLFLIFLWYAVQAKGHTTKIVRSIRLLIGLISFTCLSGIFLGILCFLHFGIGAVMYNFQYKIANSNVTTCRDNATLYCDKYAEIAAYVQRRIEADGVKKYQNVTQTILGHVLNSYRPAIAAEACNVDRVMQLSRDTEYIGDFFTAGKILATLDDELDMHNMYEIQERVGEYANAMVTPSHRLLHQMLRCSLDTMKHIVFEQLLTGCIHRHAGRLRRNAHQLVMHLPQQLATRLRHVLQEVHDLQYFYDTDYVKLLHEVTTYALQAYKGKMGSFREVLRELPRCEQVQQSRLGIPPHDYDCLLAAIHGFWIGGFGILIIIALLISICIFLVPLYEKLYNGRSRILFMLNRSPNITPSQSEKSVDTVAPAQTPPEQPTQPIRSIIKSTPSAPVHPVQGGRATNLVSTMSSATMVLKRILEQRGISLINSNQLQWPRRVIGPQTAAMSKEAVKSSTENKAEDKKSPESADDD